MSDDEIDLKILAAQNQGIASSCSILLAMIIFFTFIAFFFGPWKLETDRRIEFLEHRIGIEKETK